MSVSAASGRNPASASVRMLGHCSSFDHDRARIIMSDSVSSLRCLQARPQAGPLYSLCSQNNCQRCFCSYCPCFQKARSFNFVLSLCSFLSRFFSFQKINGSDPRCLKAETPLVPGSRQLFTSVWHFGQIATGEDSTSMTQLKGKTDVSFKLCFTMHFSDGMVRVRTLCITCTLMLNMMC